MTHKGFETKRLLFRTQNVDPENGTNMRYTIKVVGARRVRLKQKPLKNGSIEQTITFIIPREQVEKDRRLRAKLKARNSKA